MKRFWLCLCALLLVLTLCAASAEEAAAPAVTLPEVTVVSGGEADNDALFDDYVEGLFTVSKRPLRTARAVGDRLTGNDALYYGLLKGCIQDVAAGRRTSTNFEITPAMLGIEGKTWSAEELGLPYVYDPAKGYNPDDGDAITRQIYCSDVDYLVEVLLTDLPYDLYWHDKTEGHGVVCGGLTYQAVYVGGAYKLRVPSDTKIYFKFSVHSAYGVGEYETDPTRINAANTAVSRAHAIVSAHAGEGDYVKLKSYLREICDLTDYNHNAPQTSGIYGDPWQLVYVFDGDASTNVVCEGYSKAFQYLCDLSSFQKRVICYTVTGDLTVGGGSGLHMWNIVTMPDGKNYLVDVTNCDDAAGAPDKLFLAGYSYNYGNEYIFRANSLITYTYSQTTLRLYSAAELAIADTKYVDVPDPASLTTLALPAGLVTLEASALEGVPAQRILLPAGLKTIESRAFAACPNLVYINLPAGLETIAADAFADCSAEMIFVECAGDTAANPIFSTDARLYVLR